MSPVTSKRTLLHLLVGLLLAEPALSDPRAYVVGDLATRGVSSIVQNNTLFLVDLATGEADVIGQVEDASSPGTVYSRIGGISLQPSTDTLFAVADVQDTLVTINTVTGKATAIGEFTFPSISGFGLSFDAAETLYFSAKSGRRLSVIDPETALVSDIITGGAAPNTDAIADASATHLWALAFVSGGGSELLSIRKVAPGDPLPEDFITSIGTLHFDAAPIGLTNPGLDQAPDGTLWGIGRVDSSVGPTEIFEIDTTTAEVSNFTPITVPGTNHVVVNAYSISIFHYDNIFWATGNPWLAGMPDGSTDNDTDVAPDQSPRRALKIGIPDAPSLTFSVTGGAHFEPGCPIPATFPECLPPDGSTISGNHTTTADGDSNGIAALVAPYGALVGVFLDASEPDPESRAPCSPPAFCAYDFSPDGRGTDFAQLAPLLKQPFFIGDGLTTTMETQLFLVPPGAGATRLYLGIHDATGWFDNSGALGVTINIPEPTKGLLQLGGLVALVLLRTLRRKLDNAPAY